MYPGSQIHEWPGGEMAGTPNVPSSQELVQHVKSHLKSPLNEIIFSHSPFEANLGGQQRLNFRITLLQGTAPCEKGQGTQCSWESTLDGKRKGIVPQLLM